MPHTRNLFWTNVFKSHDPNYSQGKYILYLIFRDFLEYKDCVYTHTHRLSCNFALASSLIVLVVLSFIITFKCNV